MQPRITGHGLNMPKLGLGTWRLTGRGCADAVLAALSLGYRHIDTARMYGNEDGVGIALSETAVSRGEIHVTSKVWWDSLEPDAMRRSLDLTLRDLRTDYVDLYLIHWPHPGMNLPAALRALASFKRDGRARAIGVSNFNVALMRQAVEQEGAEIACNQVEYHALLDQSAVLSYARAHGIAVTAYSPLGRGALSKEPGLIAVARKHGATPEQVGLKWLLDQDGVAAVPKAARPESQRANLDALRLALDDEDRIAIANLPKDRRLVNASWAPDWDEPQSP